MRFAMDMASHPLPNGTRAYGPAQRARWTALAAEVAEANAFYAPDMLCAALDHLAGTPGVRMVEAHAGGKLIGLLPVTVAAQHGRLQAGVTFLVEAVPLGDTVDGDRSCHHSSSASRDS